MKLMKPILANATLQHLAEGFPLRIGIDTVTCTIQTLVILVVHILSIFNLFVRLQLADALAKFGVSTITAEMPSGPELHYLQRKVHFRRLGFIQICHSTWMVQAVLALQAIGTYTINWEIKLIWK